LLFTYSLSVVIRGEIKIITNVITADESASARRNEVRLLARRILRNCHCDWKLLVGRFELTTLVYNH